LGNIGALRSDLSLVMFAAAFFALGFVSIVLWTLKSRDPLLLWLGTFSGLYGLRLFITNELVVSAMPDSVLVFRYAAVIITYSIPIPLVLFMRELIGTGWRNSLNVWLWLQIGFAVVAIGAGVFGNHVDLANTANNVLIITGSLLLLLHLFFFYRGEPWAAIVKWAFAALFACVVVRNLGFEAIGQIIEPLGFLFFAAALGYTAALRTVSREQKLIEVEQELATARRIQTFILPKSVPQMDGLEIATRYVPMTAVAGDLYDFLQIDRHRLTIVVADVSGHGVPAALIASMLKVGIAAERSHASNPAAILTGLNAMLQGMLDGQFVTAACAFIDLEARTLTYSAAGHPPALLARPGSAEVVELAENGLFLGPFPGAVYANRTAPFEPGDKLLLYTDGIPEATIAGGEPFGDEGLKRFMIQNQPAGVALFADGLIRAVAGPVQEDDLTLVVVEATGSPLPMVAAL
jgi:sigma-B regulation protein RsbU (phosphoserine phosphatase)